MKKEFCVDCAHPLVRNIEKGHGAKSVGNKTCAWCTRVVAPRASRTPMRSKKK